MHIILMIVGAVVVYLLLKRIYQKNWNRHLSCDISFSASNAVCGDTVELVEVVTNYKKLPLPIIHLKFQADNALIFKDGSEIGVTGGSGVQLEEGSWQMKYQWSMPVDLNQVEAVKFGKTEVDVE